MSEEISGNGLDVTLREFVSGQKLFNRYRLIKTLGRGGMGVVWLAFDEQLERDVALKFLPELLVLDKAAMDELKRETKRSLELTHHHIVPDLRFRAGWPERVHFDGVRRWPNALGITRREREQGFCRGKTDPMEKRRLSSLIAQESKSGILFRRTQK